MAAVVGLLTDPRGRRQLKSAIDLERAAGCPHQLEWVGSGGELVGRVNRSPRSLAVLDPYIEGRLALPLVAYLVRRSGTLGIIVYSDFATRPIQEVVEMASLGVRWVVTRGVDDEISTIRRAVIEATHDQVVQDLLMDARRLLPERAFVIVECMVAASTLPVRVGEVASRLGCTTRTLNRVLQDAGLPSAGHLVRWCRLLHAIRLLEDRDRSLDQVARTLGFSDPSNLRRLARSLTSLTPAQLVAVGGSSAVKAKLLSMMAPWQEPQ